MSFTHKCELVINGEIRLVDVRKGDSTSEEYIIKLDGRIIGTASKDSPDSRKKAWTCVHKYTKEKFGGHSLISSTLNMINTVYRR